MKILNLDKLIGDDKEVIFNGKKIIIPGELPVLNVLKLQKCSQDLEETPNDAEKVEVSMRALFEVLLIKNPDLKFEEFNPTLNQYMNLIRFIYDIEDTEPGVVETDEKKTSASDSNQRLT